MKAHDIFVSFNTDELVIKRDLIQTVAISPFGYDKIEQNDFIFPCLHALEISYVDVTSLGEPFRQYVCLKGPIKSTSYSEIDQYDESLVSVQRVLSKPLFGMRHFAVVSSEDSVPYDLYKNNIDTRVSLTMHVASAELAPRDSNF